MSSNDELSSDTSSWCDVESLQLAVEGEGSFNKFHRSALIESGRGIRRCDGGRRGRRRWYTLCDFKISIRKQGNSLKLVNYKSAMPSMYENGESAVCFGKIFLSDDILNHLCRAVVLQISHTCCKHSFQPNACASCFK